MNIAQILKDIFTGADGETHDIARWSWTVSVGAAISLGVHEVWGGGHIDFLNFGSGIAAIVVAHGGAIWAKKDTEPKATNAANPTA